MMRLDPKAFNAHLNHMGQKFRLQKALRCPCLNPHSGAADPGCQNCRGKSWFWEGDIPAVAGVASQQIQLRWAQFGLWQDGDMVVSIPENSPMYDMAQFDRVIALNSTDTFSVTLVRGGANEQLYDPVEKIDRVFWLGNDGKIVNGAIPAVSDDGVLSWSGSGAPPAGKRYTVTGTRFAEFFCYGPYPSNRNEHQGARLPKRVVLRRFDLFGRDL